MKNGSNLVVGFPLYTQCTLMDFAGATQVFSAPVSGFEVVWIAESMDPVMTSENVQVVPQYTFSNCPPLDIIFVPGGSSTPDAGVSTEMFNDNYLGFLVKYSSKSMWTGSVCTGAFIVVAAGLFNGFEGDDVKGISTYWSQIPNLALLKDKFQFKVAKGFPRFTFDSKLKRFSGGGISSSLDLALKLVEIIQGPEVAEKTQLFIQYAPDPPTNSGDPGEAPPEIVSEVTALEAGFTADMNKAVQQLLKC